MGMFDKLREKSSEKFNRELEEEFENDCMGKFEELKDSMLNMYKYGYGVDDDEGCKGDINKCFSMTCVPYEIPNSYVEKFKQYILKDPEVKKILGEDNSSSSTKVSAADDEKTKELKKKLEEKRNEEDGDVIFWFTSLINKKERAIIKPFLNDDENKEISKYYNKKQELLDKQEELDSDEFIEYVKNWLSKYKNTYKYAWDIIVELNVDDELINDDEMDELSDFYDTIPEKKEETKQNNSTSTSNDISDIKAKLEKLKSLKEDGLISEEDFEKKKADLLALI